MMQPGGEILSPMVMFYRVHLKKELIKEIRDELLEQLKEELTGYLDVKIRELKKELVDGSGELERSEFDLPFGIRKLQDINNGQGDNVYCIDSYFDCG